LKKNYYRIIGIIITSFCIIALYYYYTYNNYYEIGENDNFELKVGETFEIKLYENGSTGSKNCWLKKNKLVTLVKEDYEKSMESKMGYIGSGGITTYTFKAAKIGVDTLKVSNCPLAYENKNCSDYNDKNTKPDNIFTIKISE
jgi:predicted secreted protein